MGRTRLSRCFQVGNCHPTDSSNSEDNGHQNKLTQSWTATIKWKQKEVIDIASESKHAAIQNSRIQQSKNKMLICPLIPALESNINQILCFQKKISNYHSENKGFNCFFLNTEKFWSKLLFQVHLCQMAEKNQNWRLSGEIGNQDVW